MDLKEIQAEIAERSKGPIIGPFVMTWTVKNWAIVLLLCSSEKLETKIEGVKQAANWCDFLWFPLLVSLVLTLLLTVGKAVLAWVQELINIQRDNYISKAQLRKKTPLSDVPRQMAALIFDENKNIRDQIQPRITEIMNAAPSIVTHAESVQTIRGQIEGVFRDYTRGGVAPDQARNQIGEACNRLRGVVEQIHKHGNEIRESVKKAFSEVETLTARLEPITMIDRLRMASVAAKIEPAVQEQHARLLAREPK